MGGSPDPLPVLTRRGFLRLSTVAGGVSLLGGSFGCSSLTVSEDGSGAWRQLPGSELEEATLAELGAGMESGRWTSRGLTRAYVDRVAAMDQAGIGLSSILEVNPDALDTAATLDLERA